MQFEQTQQSWPRRELNGTDSDSTSSLQNGSHQNGSQGSSEHSFSIPVNKDSKRYTMKEAFGVFFDHQQGFSADVSVPVKNGENYKYAQLQPLYHLDFSHSVNGEGEGAGEDDGDAFSPAENDVKPGLKRPQPVAPPNLTKASAFGQETTSEAAKPVLIQPENITWVYLDPAGNEQGPFTGDIMQEWLSDGYLSLDLRIRRQEETSFQTLKSFCEAVQNFIQPFKVPLPRVVSDPVQVPMPGSFQSQIADPPVPAENHQNPNSFGNNGAFPNGGPSVGGPHPQSSFGGNLYSQLLPQGGLGAANIRTPSSNGLFDFMGPSDYPLINPQYSAGNQFGLDAMNPNLSFSQLHMPSLLQQQISSQQPSLSRTNSGWGIDNSLHGSLPSTPTATATPGPLLGSSGSMSPWINRVQGNMSRVSSPFVPTSTLAGDRHEKEDNLLQDIHSSMVSGILTDEDHTRGVSGEIIDGKISVSVAEPVNSDSGKDREARSVPVSQGASEPVHPISKSEIPPSFKIPVADVPAETVPPTVSEQNDSKNAEEPEAPAQPTIAPWAKSRETKVADPPLTLKQIQDLEAERTKREKQLKAEMKQEIALANAIAASKLDEKAPEKVSFNWATSSQATAPAKKSLAEIQREEEAEAAKLRASKSATSAGAKVSLASALASTPVRDDVGGAWTTIATKKPVLKKQAPTTPSASISYSSISGAINPQALRSVSSTTVPTTTSNTQAIKEDFLVWARAAMTNLYPSVSKNDLLEVFTTLPLHGESAQLISETIYSSSATMDGRRFAQEFLKKRQAVEKQVGPSAPESWSSAIISSADKVPTVDDDGWSTSVKSKKKGRKN